MRKYMSRQLLTTWMDYVPTDNGTLDQSELLKVLEMRTDIQLEKKRPETKVKRFWSCLKDAPTAQH